MKKYLIFISIILLTLLSVNAASDTNYITILTFGEYGNRPGEFNYPVCLSLDKDNNLYVSDWENDRIQKFSSEGRLLKVIPEGEGEDELKLDGPVGLALDSEGNIILWRTCLIRRCSNLKENISGIHIHPCLILCPYILSCPRGECG